MLLLPSSRGAGAAGHDGKCQLAWLPPSLPPSLQSMPFVRLFDPPFCLPRTLVARISRTIKVRRGGRRTAGTCVPRPRLHPPKTNPHATPTHQPSSCPFLSLATAVSCPSPRGCPVASWWAGPLRWRGTPRPGPSWWRLRCSGGRGGKAGWVLRGGWVLPGGGRRALALARLPPIYLAASVRSGPPRTGSSRSLRHFSSGTRWRRGTQTRAWWCTKGRHGFLLHQTMCIRTNNFAKASLQFHLSYCPTSVLFLLLFALLYSSPIPAQLPFIVIFYV